MKKIFFALLVFLMIFASGCSASNGATIDSVEIVESIRASGGVSYKFEGKDSIQIVLNFYFDEKTVSDLDPNGGDAYKKALYAKLTKGAHLFYDNKEIDLTYGYWPEDTGSNYAKGMTLFYVVPKERSAQSLKFVYDASILGEGASGIDKIINP